MAASIMEPTDRLESWKEIAAYLERDVRTAQRWEASEDLPVHRHQHKKRGSVFALRSEIDVWRASRSAGFFSVPEPPGSGQTLATPRRRRPVLLAALTVATSVLVVAAASLIRSGPPPSPSSAPRIGWDEPRLLAEVTRDGGEFGRIPISAQGDHLALTPDGRTLFVQICKDDGTSGLEAIDIKTRATFWTVELFGGCAPIMLTATGDHVITGSNSDVVILDTTTRTIRRIATPATVLRDFALSRDGRTLFAAALFQGLLEIDVASGHVVTRSPLPCPVSLSLSPVNDRLYVGYQCSGPGGRPGHDAIDILDTKAGRSVGSITNLPNVGGDLAVSPDGSQLWADGADACFSAHYDKVGCPSGRGSIINVIATADHSPIRSVRVGGLDEYNTRLSFTPDGSRVVVGRAEISVVSTSALTLMEALPLPLWSNVVFSPDGSAAYAVMGDRRSVAVLPARPRTRPPGGLTARWTADGVFTDSAGGNDMPRESGAAFGPGRIGKALEVRSEAPIRLPRPANLGMGGHMTVMTWIKTERPGTIMEYAAIDAVGQFGWRLQLETDGRPVLCVGRYEKGQCGGAESVSIHGDTALVPGRWHHLAFTRADDTSVLYADGRRTGTGNGAKGGSLVSDILFLRFGSGESKATPFLGWMDEIEVYNRALSDQEVAERSK
jgi:DNA-binding beta-propeller fold protein YncE